MLDLIAILIDLNNEIDVSLIAHKYNTTIIVINDIKDKYLEDFKKNHITNFLEIKNLYNQGLIDNALHECQKYVYDYLINTLYVQILISINELEKAYRIYTKSNLINHLYLNEDELNILNTYKEKRDLYLKEIDNQILPIKLFLKDYSLSDIENNSYTDEEKMILYLIYLEKNNQEKQALIYLKEKIEQYQDNPYILTILKKVKERFLRKKPKFIIGFYRDIFKSLLNYQLNIKDTCQNKRLPLRKS